MKLWTMLCRASQDRQVMAERSDKTWPTGEENGKPLQYSWLENTMNSMKRQNDRILKEELPRSVGAPYATGNQWRNNSRKNEETGPKQKQYPVVDVTGDRSKVRCCKEQYCIGTWNVRSMNQSRLSSVTQSCLTLCDPLNGSTPCPSPTPRVYPNPCPLSWWCYPITHPLLSPSLPVVNFSSIRVLSNESALRIRWPKYWSFSFNINLSNEHPGWSPLGWTGWISLQSKGLSRVFSNTTVQKHQFLCTQLFL